MEIVKNRIIKLRSEIEKIQSNRERIDYLTNYYKDKKAIIVATGPNYADYIDLIKENINENTILICIKQSIKNFDMIADFHILNQDHYEKYNYNVEYKPIVLQIHYSINRIHSPAYSNGDINFYLHNIKNYGHIRKNGWYLLDSNIDSLTLNDDNLGIGENMVYNCGHIMFQLALPLAKTLGVKNIILNGFVGGSSHGTRIKNEVPWDVPRYKHLYEQQEEFYKLSINLESYLSRNFYINLYSICDTNYKIKKINSDEFVRILNLD